MKENLNFFEEDGGESVKGSIFDKVSNIRKGSVSVGRVRPNALNKIKVQPSTTKAADK